MAEQNTDNTGGVGLGVGAKVGKYEVRQRIAIGGQAIVYKCFDSLLNRYVAVKQISSALAESPKFIERFRREAQILAKLGSEQPAIITVHDLIEDERGLFIVTEFVDGHSIEASLVDSPEPSEPKAVLLIIWRLAAALRDVHQAGIIHRDIKPSNIIITEGLRPKITDFGVAGTVSGQTSMVLGTTKYMAPELFGGPKADGRADMYSLGMIAYEMLLGREKFSEVFADVVRDPHSEPMRWMKWHTDPDAVAPALSELGPGIPQALSDIVARMLAKDRDQRYQDMEALGRAIKGEFSPRGRPLADLRAEELEYPEAPVVKRPAPPPERREAAPLREAVPTARIPRRPMSLQAKLVIAGAVAVVIMIAGGVLAYMNFQAAERTRRAAQEISSSAVQHYRQGEYSAAADEYQRLLAGRFARTPQAVRASVLVHLARAHEQVIAASVAETVAGADPLWERASEQTKKAKSALDDAQADADSAEMEDWTRRTRQELNDFDTYLADSRSYYKYMLMAKELLGEGRHEEALGALADLDDAGIDLTDPQRARFNELLGLIELEEFGAIFDEHLDAAAGQIGKIKADPLGQRISQEAAVRYLEAAKGEYDQADQQLQTASDQLLGPGRIAEYGKTLAAKRAELEAMRVYVELIHKAAAATGPAAELDALVRAQVIYSTKQLDERVAELKYQTSLAEARSLKELWDTDRFPDLATRAAAAYAEALALKDAPSVRQELEALSLAVEREGFIIAGDAALAGDDYDKAVGLYEQAQQMAADVRIAGKIVEAEYQKNLAAGGQWLSQKEYVKALEAYEQARQIKPDASAEVNLLIERVSRQRMVDSDVSRGDSDRAKNDYQGAIRWYRRARKVLKDAGESTAEVDERIKRANYERFVYNGKEALKAGNYPRARADFSQAQKILDTERVRELLAEVDRLEAED